MARSDGVLAADVRPLVRLSLQVIAEENGRREQGSAGGGGRFDYAYFSDEVLRGYADKAVDQALVNLRARPAPAGTMTVVLGPGLAGRAAARGRRATGWKATSTARAARPSAAASASASPPRA